MLSIVRPFTKTAVRTYSTVGPHIKKHLSSASDANKLIVPKLKHLKPITSYQPNDTEIHVSHSIAEITPNNYIVNLAVNSTLDSVKPAVYVCCLDISGSMDGPSTFDDKDPECSKFSRWDLVKHSMNTIVHCLRPVDRLAIVPFANSTKNIMPLTNMNETGKREAFRALDAISCDGRTNMWAGLKSAMDIVNDARNKDSNVFLLLFSDGEPNDNPPRGILQEFVDKNARFPATVHTFGYGYGLDSTLMSHIAVDGGGLFAHIPDHTMCNTVFINYLSNTLATAANKVLVKSSAVRGCDSLTVVGQPNAANINMGAIQSGQPRHLTWNMKTNNIDQFRLDLDVVVHDGKIIQHMISKQNTKKEPLDRYFVSVLMDIVRSGLDKYDLAKTRGELDTLFDAMSEAVKVETNVHTKERLILLQKNIKSTETVEGQIYKAFSSDEWHTRWGVHYLKYFLRSHQLQVCSNFKDTSLQSYGGQLFREIKTEVEDIFATIPVPQPSRSSTPFQGNYTQSFYTPSGPCVDGYGFVKMAIGHDKQVKDIKIGDMVISNGNAAKVLCVIKTKIIGGVTPMLAVNGMRVTPYHPININGTWEFSIHVGTLQDMKCDFVYNFVLDSHHVMHINNVDVITLGHGIEDDPVLKHPFFGTEKVLNHLKTHPGWSKGLIELNEYKPQYENGLISSFW